MKSGMLFVYLFGDKVSLGGSFWPPTHSSPFASDSARMIGTGHESGTLSMMAIFRRKRNLVSLSKGLKSPRKETKRPRGRTEVS